MRFTIATQGRYDFVDITDRLAALLKQSGAAAGAAHVFVTGSTAALTVMEYETGVMADIKKALEKLAPEGADYQHHQRWGDHNGAAHIKAALIGPDLTVPVEQGRLQLGSWQKIVLIDFDERPRQREVIVRITP